ASSWLAGLRHFEAACLATEGVSHFLYVIFRARSAGQVSQLELELQGEVDKYAAGMFGVWAGAPNPDVDPLVGNGVGAWLGRRRREAWLDRSRLIRQRLFHTAQF